MNLEKLLDKKSLRYLDLACGDNLQQGCIGLDKRRLPGVHIVHDIEKLPWPIPAETFNGVIASHIVEHIKPWLIVDVMNEAWRVVKPKGTLMIVTPYAGTFHFWQDPT